MKKFFNKTAVSVLLLTLPALYASAADDGKAKGIFSNMKGGLLEYGDQVLTIALIVLVIVSAFVVIPQVLKLGSDRGDDAQKGLSTSAIWLLFATGFVGILKLILASLN